MPSLATYSVGGEPRVLDTDLGAMLGFSQSRSIRQIITRNRDELLQLGELPQYGRGQIALNYAQADLVASKCRVSNKDATRMALDATFAQQQQLTVATPPKQQQPVIKDVKIPARSKQAKVAQGQAETAAVLARLNRALANHTELGLPLLESTRFTPYSMQETEIPTRAELDKVQSPMFQGILNAVALNPTISLPRKEMELGRRFERFAREQYECFYPGQEMPTPWTKKEEKKA